jgi:hypothetical protein
MPSSCTTLLLFVHVVFKLARQGERYSADAKAVVFVGEFAIVENDGESKVRAGRSVASVLAS